MEVKKLDVDTRIVIKNKDPLSDKEIENVLKKMFPNLDESSFEVVDSDNDWEDDENVYTVLFTIVENVEECNIKNKVLFQGVEDKTIFSKRKDKITYNTGKDR